MNADVIQDLINSSLKDGLSHKLVKDDLSIIKNILRYAQKKYHITDISYIDDVVMPKKRLQEKKLKAKRENYLEMAEVLAIVEELNRIANKKRASYMKRSYLFTAYIVEFQVLNGMRIGELLAIQPDNIDFENKKLVIDGTIHWRKDGNKVGFKDTTKQRHLIVLYL